MTICFEIDGGCRDGALEGVEASLQYLLTNGGELGRIFWLTPGAGADRWLSGEVFNESQVAQRYQVVARAQRGDCMIIKARHVPVDYPSGDPLESDTAEFSPITLCKV